jgi:hypothetical protein
LGFIVLYLKWVDFIAGKLHLNKGVKKRGAG